MIQNAKPQATLGFRAHSGWAVLVAVAGSARTPAILVRQRIVIADPAIAGSKQPYHAAESWPLAKAQDYLDRCAQRTKVLARQAISTVVAGLRDKGYDVVGCCVLTASGKPIPSLADALSSHTMLHTAEGEFFRNALVESCEACRVCVTRIKEKELFARGATQLAMPVAKLQARVVALGRPLGPPWSQDEKYAALASWAVLAAAQRPVGRPTPAKRV